MSAPVTIESDNDGEEIYPEEVFFEDDYTEATTADEMYEIDLLQALSVFDDVADPEQPPEPGGGYR